MVLFSWPSRYLQNYGPGQIIVMAADVEAARAAARRRFEMHLHERYDFLFYGLSQHEILVDEDICQKRALFEADISAEPDRIEGALFVSGSD